MINSKPLLVVITGPTGSGKTDLSIRLAQYFGVPIISTDSRQIYKGMPIGTAQPTIEQLSQAQHYLVSNHNITDNYSCGDYEKEAIALLDNLIKTHSIVIAVGGSGLYIDALCNGIDSFPQASPDIRISLMERLETEGLPNLFEELEKLDPQYASKVDRNNPQRIIRALEVCKQTGAPYSTLRKGTKVERNFDIIKIGVTMERPKLYERIDKRVDHMIALGLIDEARGLYSYRNLNSLQTVGYQELFEYFDGEISLEEAISLIKRNSRRYAKRQLTWFNRDSEIIWFDPTQTENIIELIENRL